MHKTHGLTGKPTYNSWKAMKDRCDRKKNASYHRYGKLGITYCARWIKLENFVEDMGIRPKGTTLDRIDNDKGYFPENCRWATSEEQARNRHTTNYVVFQGKKRKLCELINEYGLSRHKVHSRLYRQSWTIEEALGIEKKIITRKDSRIITFNGCTKTVSQWAEEYNIKSTTLYQRLHNGWSIEKALGVIN